MRKQYRSAERDVRVRGGGGRQIALAPSREGSHSRREHGSGARGWHGDDCWVRVRISSSVSISCRRLWKAFHLTGSRGTATTPAAVAGPKGLLVRVARCDRLFAGRAGARAEGRTDGRTLSLREMTNWVLLSNVYIRASCVGAFLSTI